MGTSNLSLVHHVDFLASESIRTIRMEGNKIHRDREMKCDSERVGCDHYYIPAFLGTISLLLLANIPWHDLLVTPPSELVPAIT